MSVWLTTGLSKYEVKIKMASSFIDLTNHDMDLHTHTCTHARTHTRTKYRHSLEPSRLPSCSSLGFCLRMQSSNQWVKLRLDFTAPSVLWTYRSRQARMHTTHTHVVDVCA